MIKSIYDILNGIIGIEMDEVTDHVDLIEGAFLDSMALIALMSSIESEYNIKFNDSDFIIDNFRTIHMIKKTIERLSAK